MRKSPISYNYNIYVFGLKVNAILRKFFIILRQFACVPAWLMVKSTLDCLNSFYF
jgi:hypothetical protein